MSATPSPEHVRVPTHLSAAELHQALDELDAKIRTLQNRAHATTAHSQHTYHEHIAALETKRDKLAAQMKNAPAAQTPPSDSDRSTWAEVWRGIENLRNDLRNII
jgi:peptidoglycan hydrolase CwlO-like protein